MSRPFAGSSYWWMSARSHNASRRFAVMGIVGGLVFIAALIAFVLVPRQATRSSVRVSATLEERPDSNRTVAIRTRAVAEVAAADSMLALARTVVPAAIPAVDTFPPDIIAQRGVIAEEIVTLNRVIERADNAPFPRLTGHLPKHRRSPPILRCSPSWNRSARSNGNETHLAPSVGWIRCTSR